MIVGLLIGKDKSMGVPGKNVKEIVGRPMCEYGFIAARAAGVDHLFTSTDSKLIAEIGKKYHAHHIDRPAELATPESLTEDVLTHAAKEIEKTLGKKPEMIVLLFANNPAIDVNLIKQGIEALKQDSELDSAFSVCQYNMFSPTRARKIDDEGNIQSFVPLDKIDAEISSIRSSQGDVYFCDLSVQVIRFSAFENMEDGMQPFQWMGKKSKALKNDFGFDVDTQWQFLVIEYWLKSRGFTETSIPYEIGSPEEWEKAA